MKTLPSSSRYVERMYKSEEFRRALSLWRGAGRISCGNLIGSSAALFLAAFRPQVEGPLILLAATVGEALGMADDLKFFLSSGQVDYLPTSDEAGFLAAASSSAFGRRLKIAQALGRGDRDLTVVASITAFLEAMPAPAELKDSMVELRVGENCDREELLVRLLSADFEKVSHVESAGQYAVRGGIVDVFDYLAASPWRIELFADEIDSIRSFAPDTQRSLESYELASLSVVRPRPRDLANDESCRLPDLLDEEAVVVLRDTQDVFDHLRKRKEQRDLSGRPDEDHVNESSAARLRLERLPVGAAGIDFDVRAVESDGNDMGAAVATLDRLSSAGREVMLGFATDAERNRFWSAVTEESDELLLRSLETREIRGLVASLYRGFQWRAEGFAMVNHRELFNMAIQRRRVPAEEGRRSRVIDDFVDLQPGDYVVHVAHGIAQFLAIETIEKGGEVQEFLTLEFADALLLYVPVAKADLVQKYIGGKGEAPRLSKVGGRSWSKRKEEAFESAMDLAAEMLDVQAVRARKEGISYPEDSAWQHEFEAAFPYQETPDQLTSIDAVKVDMESSKPMDRLICGDVGYGKTEIAMRAAFKAVDGGKQVAVLVPTTVLAEQHLMSFRERMADYPVTIAGLSRFRSRKEQHQTLVALVEGRVDIVIGTHRLFSKDVAFKDLGLLVIDEEQRFGVAHKEKLRQLRRTVDVLTLSATPIPRTLHLSLLGIRDISSLTQAPRGRQPVETKILPFDEKQIRAAILRELERGGQVFFVHNRVQTIEKVRKDLQRIVPEAELLVLHGQLPEKEIEANLMTFVQGRADVLLATTIIESGLDVPRANTIFIDRPEMYGLADLHQLRGRVGRYRVKAHAYLLLRPGIILSNDAEKRVRAIEEFDDLGSGFRIAMRDLEIRGAGNLLGHQQSGHIAAVGYDMYCRLLDAAVKDLTNHRAVLPEEVDLNLDFEAYIPSDYIEDPKLKLEMYRKLGRCSREEDFVAVREELVDRFGQPPLLVEEFFDVARIRALAERFELKRVVASEDHGLLLRPGRLKSLRRRLLVSGCEHRIIAGKDVLLVGVSACESPAAALAQLRAALLPEVE